MIGVQDTVQVQIAGSVKCVEGALVILGKGKDSIPLLSALRAVRSHSFGAVPCSKLEGSPWEWGGLRAPSPESDFSVTGTLGQVLSHRDN